jgi:flagellar hook assembly protein FlgD
MPFPYILSVEAYNEAGEKVRTIGVIQLSSGINGMQMEEGGKITDLFNPADGSLSIIFPGIDSPGSTGGVTLDWDAKNDSGMDVSQGVYYIKAEVMDNYGHVNTLTEQITVLKTEEWARISIYNEAGEIVARLQDNVAPAEPIELESDNVILVGGGAAPAAFKYSASGTLYWDGKNSFGDLVSSGIYEIQLEVKTKNGYSTVVESKTVTVLAAQPGRILGDVKVYPNPCVFQDEPAAPVTINWTNKSKGEVTIRIYNIAGELIKTIRAGLDSLPGANWDMTSSNGKYTGSGLYVIVIHARSAAGQQETKKIKFAVIQKYIYNNDLVN